MAGVPYSEKYRNKVDTSFYDNEVAKYTQEQNANRQKQINEAGVARDQALRQAYITKMQNQQTLNNNLASAGIRGGATETSNLRLANQYGTQQAAANTDYSNNVNQINQSIDQNISAYRQDMMSRAEEYRQNRASEMWQAAREDAENNRTFKTNEKNRLTDYWSNYYSNKYSGWSKKDLKKEEKSIKAKLKKAKTAGEKIRWQQALAGIGARRGVIANK